MILKKKQLEINKAYITTYPNTGNKYLNYITSIIDEHIGGKYIDLQDFVYDTAISIDCGETADHILASDEDTYWIKECINANKFISKDDAMKTFIPEYVECIQWIGNLYKSGNIYEVIDEKIVNNDNLKYVYYHGVKHNFKPSTKEAYEAQFKSKEPEFLLPEKWYIIVTDNNIKKLKEWYITHGYSESGCKIGNLIGRYKWNDDDSYQYGCNIKDKIKETGHYGYDFGIEITFDQFEKYVLKENIEESNDIKQSNDNKYTLDELSSLLKKYTDLEDIDDIINTIKRKL